MKRLHENIVVEGLECICNFKISRTKYSAIYRCIIKSPNEQISQMFKVEYDKNVDYCNLFAFDSIHNMWNEILNATSDVEIEKILKLGAMIIEGHTVL